MKDRKLPDLRSMKASEVLAFATRYKADPDPVRRWMADALTLVLKQLITLLRQTNEHKTQLREDKARRLIDTITS